MNSLISWRIVAMAGGVAWLLVGGLTVTVWATSRLPGMGKERVQTQSTELSEPIALRDTGNLVQPFTTILEAVAALPGEKEPVKQLTSFKKEPASPPLAAEEEERAAEGPGLPVSELSLGEPAASCRNYGTQVAFVSSPTEAARKAAKDRKLLFVLHLSGHFDDAKFT